MHSIHCIHCVEATYWIVKSVHNHNNWTSIIKDRRGHHNIKVCNQSLAHMEWMRKGLKKTYLTILQKSTRLEDVHKEKKVREQDEENEKDGIKIPPEPPSVWSSLINTLLLCFGQGGKRGADWPRRSVWFQTQRGSDNFVNVWISSYREFWCLFLNCNL